MRLSDTRLQGKAGLLFPQLRRVQRSVAERLQKACEKVMPGEALATAQAVRAVKARIEQRISELASDGVKAACMVHPHNLKELREEQDPEGRMHKVMLESRCAFYKVARVHPQWAAVQNQAVEYMNQKGIWLNGELLNKHERLTLEAFWDDVAAHCNNHALKEFMLDLLSPVVDSADAERLWCVFQAADPKGSKRSRLIFAHKEMEVGIASNVALKKYLKRKGQGKMEPKKTRKKFLKKTPSEIAALPAPTIYAPLADGSEGELEDLGALEDEQDELEALEDLEEEEDSGEEDELPGEPSESDAEGDFGSESE